MNNDLISREALRKDIEHLYSVYAKNKEWFYTDVLNHIDNAPTVVNEYTKGFADGERSGRNFPLTDEEKAILVRQWLPHGEWIIEHDWVHCSSCGHEQNYPSNYCPNCGAEMKGGAE